MAVPAETEHCTVCLYLETGQNQDMVCSTQLIHGEKWCQHCVHTTYYLNAHMFRLHVNGPLKWNSIDCTS